MIRQSVNQGVHSIFISVCIDEDIVYESARAISNSGREINSTIYKLKEAKREFKRSFMELTLIDQ